jgi:prepilin-type N-terminal cleavage/methylation domain-containing protein
MTGKKERGITLIEMVIAITILALVSLSTAAMIGAQVEGMAKSRDLTSAGNAARLAMEKLLNIPYASVANGNLTVSPYVVSWTVTTTAGANSAERKDIVMTVNRGGSGPNLSTLNNSITKDTTFSV